MANHLRLCKYILHQEEYNKPSAKTRLPETGAGSRGAYFLSRHFIDMRSDTATRPTQAMRQAIAEAQVGDETLREDPSVNELIEKATAQFGKEDGLFVSSGTLANQLAIKVHTNPGDEIIADSHCHPFRSELGAGPFLSGVQFALLSANRGVYTREDAEKWLRPPGGYPKSALLWVENTHNQGGGHVFPLEKLDELRTFSNELNIPLHIDGARIFNAIIASGISANEWARRGDSMCFCFSKGLGCPVGSILLGEKAFIQKARRYWKMWGGGWRQAGILAAAGVYALDHHIERLADDHANAQLLSELTAGIPGVKPVHDTTPTNLVFLDISDTGQTAQRINETMMEKGVAFSVPNAQMLRAVTHLDVSREDVQTAAQVLADSVR